MILPDKLRLRLHVEDRRRGGEEAGEEGGVNASAAAGGSVTSDIEKQLADQQLRTGAAPSHRDTRGLGTKVQPKRCVCVKKRYDLGKDPARREISEFSKLCRSRNYLFGVSKNSQLLFLSSFLV